ncbi:MULTISPECIES: 23S rRNA pseudouridine(2605) synthase RluB [unclassified Neptuniibacter]|uniref:23S rRNA pseudouridine(2605) synthase RluB n=1 Tax=unclassified Neptuniibacter TaxID=2630693 RepID=UPI000C62B69A|nr:MULTISPECIES: pseudouridine synthase [unclassified Neptuniibacter]MAY42732.1 23S rRNA pseudouridylate synthase B [Oceanospirillaceae bacterium]|tara:strand:+ start:51927 stop:52757 length:831 start_codon:yes stop_codon:yes gene_type:complete
MSDEKLHKVLARSGIGSRREMERWIKEGRVTVNDKVATLGDRISEGDVASVDGAPVNLIFDRQSERRVLIYNKPVGEICTRHDPEGRPTVFDHLPPLKEGRWIAIGRLDINTSGLLLFTTDGDLANALMHPSAQIDREYAVRVLGNVDDALLKRLTDGVLLEDGMAKFTDVQFFDGEGANKWYHCVVMEGRNREVRRLWESQEIQVSRLKRVRFGPVFLPSDVRAGTWKLLEDKEVNSLSQMLELKPKKGARMSVVEKQKFERRYKKQKARRMEGK